MLRLLGLGHCELSLLLTGDAAIRKLNREFRGVDADTDVLSFSQLEEVDDCRATRAPKRMPASLVDVTTRARRRGTKTTAPSMLGDVVISVETARRQANELGELPASRIRTLLIHGLLHLLGYDHERSAAAARTMFARERELAAHLAPMAAPAAAAQAAHPDWPPAAMPPAGTQAPALKRRTRRVASASSASPAPSVSAGTRNKRSSR